MREKIKPPKRVVIIGGTSGIGKELALRYINAGNIVGITGRREGNLEEIKSLYPQCYIKRMDVTTEQSISDLDELIEEMGGMDLMIFCAGVGDRNSKLNLVSEMLTVQTNVVGFSRIIIHSYNYFERMGGGHIAAISSLAGIKPLRQSPAYSATKRFQIHYLSCLAQKSYKEKTSIIFTTIVPGFIRTDFLKTKYPFTTSVDRGAKLIFEAIEKRRRYTTVPGRWRWIEFIWRLIPDFIWERIW